MTRHAARAAQAVAMLDLLTDYFDGGKHWLAKGPWHDGDRRCLVSALASLRARHSLSGDPTRYYIRAAILRFYRWRCTLVELNDAVAKDYADVARVLAEARRLAETDAASYQPAVKLAA